ncbi:MAG: hypothetical protein ACLRR3_01190 [Eubacterium sp.]
MEYSPYSADSNLIAIIVKIILQKYSISIVTPNYIFLGIVTAVYTILMIMFVYKTGIPAMDDQELILNAANDLLNNVPDMWDKGAYCYRFLIRTALFCLWHLG